MPSVRNRRHQLERMDSNSNHSVNDQNDGMRGSATQFPGQKMKDTEVDTIQMFEPLTMKKDQDCGLPMGGADKEHNVSNVANAFADPNDIYCQGAKLLFCYAGLQASYLTWGYMQELIMTTVFDPTKNVPNGKFPSAAFCVFSNRFLAVIVGAILCRLKHGAFFCQQHSTTDKFRSMFDEQHVE